MHLKIERGQQTDLSAINKIYNYYVQESNATFDDIAWDESQRLKWFRQFSENSKRYNLFVAKSGEEVVGFACNSKFKEKPAYSTSSEVTVYVKASLESHGIGRALYEVLLSSISGTELHRLYAVITIPNAASIRLHEKFGFSAIGIMSEVGFKNGEYHSTTMFEKCIRN